MSDKRSKWSQRDYVMAAGVVSATGGDYATREEMAVRFAAVFADDNPRFDQGRFLTACGFGG